MQPHQRLLCGLAALSALHARGLTRENTGRAQARPPLDLQSDSTGVLSAIRAVDLRQLCRCRTVMLDSMVRRAPEVRVFGFLGELPAFALTSGDVGNLRLAGHRVVRTSLRTLGNGAPDTAFMAVQLVVAGPGGPTRQIVVIATPPDAMTVAYLVTLVPHKRVWRVQALRHVLEP